MDGSGGCGAPVAVATVMAIGTAAAGRRRA